MGQQLAACCAEHSCAEHSAHLLGRSAPVPLRRAAPADGCTRFGCARNGQSCGPACMQLFSSHTQAPQLSQPGGQRSAAEGWRTGPSPHLLNMHAKKQMCGAVPTLKTDPTAQQHIDSSRAGAGEANLGIVGIVQRAVL